MRGKEAQLAPDDQRTARLLEPLLGIGVIGAGTGAALRGSLGLYDWATRPNFTGRAKRARPPVVEIPYAAPAGPAGVKAAVNAMPALPISQPAQAAPAPAALPSVKLPQVTVGATPKKPQTPAREPTGPAKLGEAGPLGGVAEFLVKNLGLEHAPDGSDWGGLKDYLLPRDATGIMSAPLATAALPAVGIGGYLAGHHAVDSAFRGLRQSDDESELEAAKGRYEAALRSQGRAKVAEDATPSLDRLFDLYEKSAGLDDNYMSTLALAASVPALFMGSYAFSKTRGEDSRRILAKALEQRRRQSFGASTQPFQARAVATVPDAIEETPDAGDAEEAT